MLQKAQLFTAVGKKVVMAITGLALCIFLVGHLVGNIQLFWNQPQFNAYAHFLTVSMGPLVILFELGLLAILLLHVMDALLLLRGNYAARPVGYVKKGWGRSKSTRSRKTWSSTLMMWSGTAILLFIILHVWEMKYHHPIASAPLPEAATSSIAIGVGNAGIASSGSQSPGHEVYDLSQQVKNEFKNPILSGFYIAMMFLLGTHLYHAVSSALTSVGANHPRYTRAILWFGRIFTFGVCGAFACIPLFVLLGLIK